MLAGYPRTNITRHESHLQVTVPEPSSHSLPDLFIRNHDRRQNVAKCDKVSRAARPIGVELCCVQHVWNVWFRVWEIGGTPLRTY